VYHKIKSCHADNMTEKETVICCESHQWDALYMNIVLICLM